MTTSTHGGPRPKVRPDDGRTRNRPPPGPGRKPKSFTLKLGDAYFVSTKDADGNAIGLGELWTVAEIERTYVILSSDTGDRIKLLR